MNSKGQLSVVLSSVRYKRNIHPALRAGRERGCDSKFGTESHQLAPGGTQCGLRLRAAQDKALGQMPSIPESLELAREALSAQREELGQDRQGQPEVDASHPAEDVKLALKPGHFALASNRETFDS